MKPPPSLVQSYHAFRSNASLSCRRRSWRFLDVRRWRKFRPAGRKRNARICHREVLEKKNVGLSMMCYTFGKEKSGCVLKRMCYNIPAKWIFGPVAQLGERSVRIREVESSSLFRSTIHEKSELLHDRKCVRIFCLYQKHYILMPHIDAKAQRSSPSSGLFGILARVPKPR